jgi:hypothetical protein
MELFGFNILSLSQFIDHGDSLARVRIVVKDGPGNQAGRQGDAVTGCSG